MAQPITARVGADAAAGDRPAAAAASSRFQVRLFGGRAYSELRVAAVSGPTITLIVGAACVALGLSVIWRGDASETAAGFWPPAGAALVAFVMVAPRRWGWVFLGVLFPTFIGLGLGVMPTSAAWWWAIGNCAEPALAAIVLRQFAASRWCTPGRVSLVFFSVAVVAWLEALRGHAQPADGSAR